MSPGRLRNRIEFWKRNLILHELATPQEIEALASRHLKGREIGDLSKDELWEWCADIRSLGRRAEWVSGASGSRITQDEMDAALEAMEERGEYVELPSSGETVHVVPASRDRIELIEHLEWNLNRLELGRLALIRMIDRGEDVEIPGYDVDACPSCGRPTRASGLSEVVERFREEIAHHRALLCTQVGAPGPEPVELQLHDDPKQTKEWAIADWATKVTPLEWIALVQAYHRVNSDLINRLPKPRSRDGQRDLPEHLSFLFASLEARTDKKVPAKWFMRHQSLAAVFAAISLEGIQHEVQREKARQKANAGGSAGESEEAAPRARPARRRPRRP